MIDGWWGKESVQVICGCCCKELPVQRLQQKDDVQPILCGKGAQEQPGNGYREKMCFANKRKKQSIGDGGDEGTRDENLFPRLP